MWRLVLILFLLICLCEVRSDTAPCVDLNSCISMQGVQAWQGPTPDPDNIDPNVFKPYYEYLCNNRAQYINCEVHNRTLARGCTWLAGTGMIEADSTEISKIVTKTCIYRNELVDAAVCLADQSIAVGIGNCDQQFRIEWGTIITNRNADVKKGFCRTLFLWTTCRGTEMNGICKPEIAALNDWTHDVVYGLCGGAETPRVVNNVAIIALSSILLIWLK